jgi:hypothetical protein
MISMTVILSEREKAQRATVSRRIYALLSHVPIFLNRRDQIHRSFDLSSLALGLVPDDKWPGVWLTRLQERARHCIHSGFASGALTMLLAAIILFPSSAFAHLNSPDVYFDGSAGPYKLLVTIKPPAVVPGIAEIQIRSATEDVQTIKILPLKMLGEGANLAPTPDVAERSQTDPQLFHGKLWIMTRGSWKVQIAVEGARGAGRLYVPLPAVSTRSARMQRGLGVLLAGLGLLLVAGLVGIVGAAVREASLPAGEQPAPELKRRSYRREAVATVLVLGAIFFGDRWWRAEAAVNARLNYKIPHLQADFHDGNHLLLKLQEPNLPEIDRYGVESGDKLVLNDLVPDHGHLMHLFLVRMPDMNSFWHLHPEQVGEGQFTLNLPSLPAGHYRLYADILHRTGFPETQIGDIALPHIAGASLVGDDSGEADLAASDTVSRFADGYRMVWERDSSPLKANVPLWFRFRIEDKNGYPATVMENYMGMAVHAAIISADGSVFAHVHPAGSVSMTAEMLAEGETHDMSTMRLESSGAEVSFPYGFPRPGNYRLFVQVKRAGRVETGVFRAQVK